MQEPIQIPVIAISILDKTDNLYVLSEGPSGYVVSGINKASKLLVFAIPFDSIDEAINKFRQLAVK